MYGALKPILFQLDPERAHELAMTALAAAQTTPALLWGLGGPAPAPDPRLATTAAGLNFPRPLGLAAGFDKGARAYNSLLALGFGHVEVGTVTLRSQPGNDGQRMQRLPAMSALVNRLGFPNPGADVVAKRLAAQPPKGIVGVNVGPNKDAVADLAKGSSDVAQVAVQLARYAGYVALNVSSPNTPGLRALQEPAALAGLVGRILSGLDDASCRRPLFVKLHPDGSADELVAVARAAVDAGASGIIATNTTRARPPGSESAIEGGLSGAPLTLVSREKVRALYHGLHGDVPIIGVGGVASGADALAMIEAGATLVQAYTGFVYRGPQFAVKVEAELLAALDAAGLDKPSQAVGRAA